MEDYMGKNTKLQKKPGVIIPFALSSEYYFSKGLKYHQQRDYQKAKDFWNGRGCLVRMSR